jgi:hypothetical protein
MGTIKLDGEEEGVEKMVSGKQNIGESMVRRQ